MQACLVMLLSLVVWSLSSPLPPSLFLGHSWSGGAEGDRCTYYLLLSPLTFLPSALLLPYVRGPTLYFLQTKSLLPELILLLALYPHLSFCHLCHIFLFNQDDYVFTHLGLSVFV